MKITQTAGRDALGDFAPAFAHYNDDILFGENWNDDGLDTKTRCILTLTSLISQGITDSSLRFHMENAKKNGVTGTEMAAIITHIAFYAGWPKAWAAFPMAKDVYSGASTEERTADEDMFVKANIFGKGVPNTAFAEYFTGNSFLNRLTEPGASPLSMANVTFEPGCRNNWHVHRAEHGGGQILLCVAGEGWYQEEGKPPMELLPGMTVVIPANVRHWHGAKRDSWFSHISIEVPGEGCSNEWLDPVGEDEYPQ